MSAFLQWCAADLSKKQEQLREHAKKYHGLAVEDGQHKRTPAAIAELAAGLELFCHFANEKGALSGDQRKSLMERFWTALKRTTEAQINHQFGEDPCQRFLELVNAALDSGVANLEPATSYDGSPGAHIGWYEDDYVYLNPEAVYGLVTKLTREHNEVFPLQQKTLWKRFRAAGLIVKADGRRNQLTWRRRRVICMSRKEFPGAPMPQEIGKLASGF
jgi:hypothetical protein